MIVMFSLQATLQSSVSVAEISVGQKCSNLWKLLLLSHSSGFLLTFDECGHAGWTGPGIRGVKQLQSSVFSDSFIITGSYVIAYKLSSFLLIPRCPVINLNPFCPWSADTTPPFTDPATVPSNVSLQRSFVKHKTPFCFSKSSEITARAKPAARRQHWLCVLALVTLHLRLVAACTNHPRRDQTDSGALISNTSLVPKHSTAIIRLQTGCVVVWASA